MHGNHIAYINHFSYLFQALPILAMTFLVTLEQTLIHHKSYFQLEIAQKLGTHQLFSIKYKNLRTL